MDQSSGAYKRSDSRLCACLLALRIVDVVRVLTLVVVIFIIVVVILVFLATRFCVASEVRLGDVAIGSRAQI